MRTSKDFVDLIVWGKPLPPMEAKEIEMPDGLYVCMYCNTVNSYFKWTCEKCEDQS